MWGGFSRSVRLGASTLCNPGALGVCTPVSLNRDARRRLTMLSAVRLYAEDILQIRQEIKRPCNQINLSKHIRPNERDRHDWGIPEHGNQQYNITKLEGEFRSDMSYKNYQQRHSRSLKPGSWSANASGLQICPLMYCLERVRMGEGGHELFFAVKGINLDRYMNKIQLTRDVFLDWHDITWRKTYPGHPSSHKFSLLNPHHHIIHLRVVSW